MPPGTVEEIEYRIQRYRPRIEGLFARIERWTNRRAADTFWRSISKDNITTWYGKTAESRIADPADTTRIFTWLICESYDDKGNVIVYGYKAENSDGIDLSQVHERNRPTNAPANRYLKRIRYGNRTPYLRRSAATTVARTAWRRWSDGSADWFFEVVFDYGEHDADDADAQRRGTHGRSRNDPFSSYRAGFEVRTYRSVPARPDVPSLPRRGRRRRRLPGALHRLHLLARRRRRPMPRNPDLLVPADRSTQSGTGARAERVSEEIAAAARIRVHASRRSTRRSQEVDRGQPREPALWVWTAARYQWVDLDGEGISGILTEQAEAGSTSAT